MRIKQVELTNFKRFTNLTLDLGGAPKKIIALVGPNGCGKSSIFDSFEEITKNYKGNVGSPKPEFLSKTFFMEGLSGRYNRNEHITITKEDGSVEFNKKSFYIRSPYRFVPSFNIQNIRKLTDIIEDDHRPASSMELDRRFQENYERLHGLFHDEVYDSDMSGREWQEKYITKINEILKEVLEIRISSLGNIRTGKGQLYFEKGIVRDFPYENLSSGEKEVIDLIIDLVLKTKDFDETIFCIDEPELHINHKIQRALLIEIEKLIPDNCQLWIATHSLGFLRALQSDALRDKAQILDFSEKNLDEETIITPMITTRENYKKLFNVALEDLTELIAPETIIYCEGKSNPSPNGDERGIDAKIYNRIFGESHPQVLFVSSGGNTELEKYSEIAVKVLNKAFKDVNLFILKDKDINPDATETTDEQRSAFLVANNQNRMLKRREIENYLFEKEILKKYCQSRDALNFNEGDYDSLVQNIASFNIKDNLPRIKEICQINENYPNNQLKEELAQLITPDTQTYQELLEVMMLN